MRDIDVTMIGVAAPRIRRLWCLVLLAAAPCGCSSKKSANADGPALADGAVLDGGSLPSADATSTAADADSADLPASTTYSSWRDCGDYDETIPSTAPRAECLCRGVNECDAVFGVSWLAMGSERLRVCGKANGACRVVTFSETEGGGTGRTCNVPLGTAACAAAPVKTGDLLGYCETRFTCNLVQGTCPADLLRCD